MSRNTLFVLGVGLLLGFGLTLNVGANDTGLERPRLALTTLDGPGNVGQDTSVTIGADGLGLISYHDITNRTLKVAHCSNRACTAATLTTLDSAGEVGQDTSVTIGADRLGLISYYDTTNGNLKVAHCPTSFAVLPTAVAEQLGITESHHSKNGVTESLPVKKKKDGATTERESTHVGSF